MDVAVLTRRDEASIRAPKRANMVQVESISEWGGGKRSLFKDERGTGQPFAAVVASDSGGADFAGCRTANQKAK